MATDVDHENQTDEDELDGEDVRWDDDEPEADGGFARLTLPGSRLEE
jgi:hypothetical protein